MLKKTTKLKNAKLDGKAEAYEEVARWRCGPCGTGTTPILRGGRFFHGLVLGSGYECVSSMWWQKIVNIRRSQTLEIMGIR